MYSPFVLLIRLMPYVINYYINNNKNKMLCTRIAF